MATLRSYDDRVRCKECGYSGQVKSLKLTEGTLNGDEDGPSGLKCPQCDSILVVHGWLDFCTTKRSESLEPEWTY